MNPPKHHRIFLAVVLFAGISALTGCQEVVGTAARSSIVSFANSVFNSALTGALGG